MNNLNNSTLQNLTDNYAPLQCKKIALLSHSPCYTSALRREKRARRRGERVAARTQLDVDWHIVQNMYRRRNEQLAEAKSTYFTNKFEESKDDPKALFRLTRNMMGNSGDKILPVHTCKRKLANDFSAFFYKKILNIRRELGLTETHTGGSVTNCFFWSSTKYLYGCYWSKDMNIIKLSPVKSCELDSLPTWLLKEWKAELVSQITDIVNMSLRESMIPKSLKIVLIRQLLKKTSLNSDSQGPGGHLWSKTCRFHLRNISRIRRCIPQDTSVVLIKSLVMSRLDYSNGLLYGLPKCTVFGLQAVQTSVARILTQERLRDHDSISRALMELHWLPVDKSI